jgi:hypothetical protein
MLSPARHGALLAVPPALRLTGNADLIQTMKMPKMSRRAENTRITIKVSCTDGRPNNLINTNNNVINNYNDHCLNSKCNRPQHKCHCNYDDTLINNIERTNYNVPQNNNIIQNNYNINQNIMTNNNIDTNNFSKHNNNMENNNKKSNLHNQGYDSAD